MDLSTLRFLVTTGYRLYRESTNVNALLGTTDFLLLFEEADSIPSEFLYSYILVCVGVLVAWLTQFRQMMSNNAAPEPVCHRINLGASSAIKCLQLVLSALTFPDSDTKRLQNTALKHLNFLVRVTSSHPNKWSEYHNKLCMHCDALIQRDLCTIVGGTSLSSALYPPDLQPVDESGTQNSSPNNLDDRISLAEIRQSVFKELSQLYPQYATECVEDKPGLYWSRAFEVSGVMDLVGLICVSHTTNNSSSTTSTMSPPSYVANANEQSLRKQLKSQLREMRVLYYLLTFSEREKDLFSQHPTPTTESHTDPPSVSSSHRESLTSSEVGDWCAHSNCGRKLINPGNVQHFVGPSVTPPPSPPKSTKNRLIFKLTTPANGVKRIPWTIEESIALWHGVEEHGDRWSQIWRRSFRLSRRGPVDLKDRWRVVKKSQLVKNAISQVYDTWKSEQLTDTGTLPTPVVIRSSVPRR